MKKLFPLLIFVLLFSKARSQEEDTTTAQVLPEVTIRSFEQNRRLRDVPAAINLISSAALNRFGPASLVAAVNSTPGIRLEERSPGSYRFNIRGSSLRSPFGVRNIKVYVNDIPFTQPGGTTYLNQLGFYNVQSMEVIKGPGSSLYGAGTGGVVLIESMQQSPSSHVEADYTFGSFNSHNAHAAVVLGKENNTNRIDFQHQQSAGYREQSSLKRTIFSWTGNYKLAPSSVLKTTFLYGNLFYETPGALTAAEFRTDPKKARPLAAAARAAIRQQSFVAGASLEQKWGKLLSNKTVVYGASTLLRNPNLRGYDQSTEPHAGGRTIFTLEPQINWGTLQLQAGAEAQWGTSDISNAKNLAGEADSLRYRDDVSNRQLLYFVQAIHTLSKWQFTAGASVSSYKLAYQRFAPQTSGKQERRFNNELAARAAVLRNVGPLSLYASVSKGFSPPSLSELLPTGGAINTTLSPEQGINYDLGARGNWGRLRFDVNLFYFRLQNTIVQRRDSAGGDFYVNSGNTAQKGLETSLQYALLERGKIKSAIWAAFTHHNFRYRNFKQLEADFSGRRLPGVAPNAINAGADVSINNFSIQTTYQYTDALPLNDANTAISNVVHLLGAQVQYKIAVTQKRYLRLYTGADNLLNQRYSLGYDINAFGGRYFNAAPTRNYYIGFSARL
jgi:iron complex outermembrane recepter protein